MDMRLIFRSFRHLKREDASRKVHSLLNCERRLRPKRSTGRGAEKSPSVYQGTRTANRHRWVGRIYQGARVNPG